MKDGRNTARLPQTIQVESVILITAELDLLFEYITASGSSNKEAIDNIYIRSIIYVDQIYISYNNRPKSV